ncbi:MULTISPECIES: thiamine-phosphate kinase [Arthrobacter]|uniref:Thiamine-monophosphate kinase n=2 Tax=Arthrobacter TaxID=1663 RepID=A0ABU9KF83_9MICC|nr:thiamine-phosphate kinase [Arthrobacter sp. YJM1]MDP5225546.1 thiamine-phosphate kinase [Arthrobacter sp. YJM1]
MPEKQQTENPATEQQLTVASAGESGLLARIFPLLPEGTATLLGPGDDAAVVAAPDGRVVVSIDTQTQDQDFRLHWNNGYASTGHDVGWKSAAQNLSDMNAMGAVPHSLLISLTLPPSTPVAWVEGFARGVHDAVRTLGADVAVVGGDLGRGREISVTATAMGNLAGAAPALRSGARPGDVVAVAGTLGRAAAGFALLESDVPFGSLDAPQRALMDAQCRPTPPLGSGPRALAAGVTAMMDVSDGLLKDASRLARASGCTLVLDAVVLASFAAALLPAATLLAGAGHAAEALALGWAVGGGEDFALLSTFPGSDPVPDGFTVIGSVVPTAPGRDHDAVLAGGSGDDAPDTTRGWDHFGAA